MFHMLSNTSVIIALFSAFQAFNLNGWLVRWVEFEIDGIKRKLVSFKEMLDSNEVEFQKFSNPEISTKNSRSKFLSIGSLLSGFLVIAGKIKNWPFFVFNNTRFSHSRHYLGRNWQQYCWRGYHIIPDHSYATNEKLWSHREFRGVQKVFKYSRLSLRNVSYRD